MNQIQCDRLIRLADFIEKLPPERFDFSTWVGDEWEGKPDLSCGTTACAVGWASTMPEFRALGLELGPIGPHESMAYPRLVGSKVRGWSGAIEACTTVFGLTESEAAFLFVARNDPEDNENDQLPEDATAKDVAARIRSFVDGYLNGCGGCRE
jgi:hypothetical protein